MPLLAVAVGLALSAACAEPTPADRSVDAGASASADAAPIDPAQVVPTEPAALQAWLAADSYRAFAGESAPHASAGPHGQVRTFLNAPLDRSLADGAAQHPVGAAAVKELFTDGTLTGWAVAVRTAPSAGGAGWYWYEVFSTSPGAGPDYAGQGLALCVQCHTRGRDQVRITYPLR
ncbi:MAG: hypothetical protein KA297_03640 [Kofleriaceae bacterium]|nr:hypothetical protein [Kofleriaceae bacterium]